MAENLFAFSPETKAIITKPVGMKIASKNAQGNYS